MSNQKRKQGSMIKQKIKPKEKKRIMLNDEKKQQPRTLLLIRRLSYSCSSAESSEKFSGNLGSLLNSSSHLFKSIRLNN